MTVGGYRLPDALVDAMRTGRLKRPRGSWELRSNHDAYGQPLESDLGEVKDRPEIIARATAELSEHFRADGVYGQSSPDLSGPGGLPDIVDFSGIVCFGSGDGAPFCLDYRGFPDRPRVIWWDDVYWRVTASDFDTFLALFDLDR